MVQVFARTSRNELSGGSAHPTRGSEPNAARALPDPQASRRSGGSASNLDLSVLQVTTHEGLIGLRTVWTALLSECDYTDVFMSHAWAVAWWTHFGGGRQLRIDVVYQGDRPVGLAPLMISRESYGGLPARVLGFLTNEHTSRSALLIPRHRGAVLRALARHWKQKSREWDVLRLLHLPRRSDQMQDLVAALRAENLIPFGPERSNELFFTPSDRSWDAYLHAQGRKFRRNLNHARNCLAKAGQTSVEVVSRVEDLDAAIGTLFELDKHSHKQGVEHAIYTQNEKDFCAALCRELADSPQTGFEVWILKLDGRPICALLVLLHAAKSVLLVTYYDERLRDLQPGRNLFAAVLNASCGDARVREVDFNGNSPFVRSWTSASDVFEQVSVCHRRPYSLLIAASKILKRAITRLKTPREDPSDPPA